MITNAFVGSRLSFDEIITIVRPVIYVFLVVKMGKKSYFPLKVAFLLDFLQTVIGITRLSRSASYE